MMRPIESQRRRQLRLRVIEELIAVLTYWKGDKLLRARLLLLYQPADFERMTQHRAILHTAISSRSRCRGVTRILHTFNHERVQKAAFDFTRLSLACLRSFFAVVAKKKEEKKATRLRKTVVVLGPRSLRHRVVEYAVTERRLWCANSQVIVYLRDIDDKIIAI